jgi:hypothetical protein
MPCDASTDLTHPISSWGVFRPRKIYIVACLIIFLFLLSVATDCQNSWTQECIERRWPQAPPPPTVYDIYAQYFYVHAGWSDPNGRFYAAQNLDEHTITVVDRLNKRWCRLGTSSWMWARFFNDSYEVHVSSQYGLSATTSLNLSSWEVSNTVSGACFQVMSCSRVDPPEITSPGYCDPDQIYGPAGNSN